MLRVAGSLTEHGFVTDGLFRTDFGLLQKQGQFSETRMLYAMGTASQVAIRCRLE